MMVKKPLVSLATTFQLQHLVKLVIVLPPVLKVEKWIIARLHLELVQLAMVKRHQA